MSVHLISLGFRGERQPWQTAFVFIPNLNVNIHIGRVGLLERHFTKRGRDFLRGKLWFKRICVVTLTILFLLNNVWHPIYFLIQILLSVFFRPKASVEYAWVNNSGDERRCKPRPVAQPQCPRLPTSAASLLSLWAWEPLLEPSPCCLPLVHSVIR